MAEREPSAITGDPVRHAVDLGRAEAMRLLASVTYGRIVFTHNALPAIRPVNHLVDNQVIVVRTALSSGFSHSVREDRSMVVAYEADEIDPALRLGWSVVVTGLAYPITAPSLLAEYGGRLRPWVQRQTDALIAIEPTLITGTALVEAAAA